MQPRSRISIHAQKGRHLQNANAIFFGITLVIQNSTVGAEGAIYQQGTSIMNVNTTTINVARASMGGSIVQKLNAKFICVKLEIENSAAVIDAGAIAQQGNSVMEVTETTITNSVAAAGSGGSLLQTSNAKYSGVTLVIQNSTAIIMGVPSAR
eukprot:PhF_6_TR32558/c0_g2_i1/m.48189